MSAHRASETKKNANVLGFGLVVVAVCFGDPDTAASGCTYVVVSKQIGGASQTDPIWSWTIASVVIFVTIVCAALAMKCNGLRERLHIAAVGGVLNLLTLLGASNVTMVAYDGTGHACLDPTTYERLADRPTRMR